MQGKPNNQRVRLVLHGGATLHQQRLPLEKALGAVAADQRRGQRREQLRLLWRHNMRLAGVHVCVSCFARFLSGGRGGRRFFGGGLAPAAGAGVATCYVRLVLDFFVLRLVTAVPRSKSVLLGIYFMREDGDHSYGWLLLCVS